MDHFRDHQPTCDHLITLPYFYSMIKEKELRIGNHIMQKVNNRIVTVTCNYEHFDLLSKGGKDIFS